ncbi:O26 family O-antigen polymerase, partial [Escherichia coli]|nr:O26 family O-antigen polymerase [Escherichia coli]EES3800801.1 O26 family O-antigen polymerase [Escherichia coli]EEV3910082.1 O26 family O-antigen polymerase [Escherichia coli]EFB9558212.1 O26 family O-antigen polymerase [Escherichia coli]EFK7187637.1 O26 family O-antigen polymerase [Escherichia coli]
MYYIIFVMVLGLWIIAFNYARANKLSNLVIVLIITTLFIINRQNQDYEAYVDIFNVNELYAEIGYRWLIYGVKYLGGTHEVIIGLLGLFLGTTFLRLIQYSKYTAFGLLLYMLCPMPIDIVQIRNTFLFLFVINSLIELEKEHKFNSLCFVFMAPLFHSLGIVYVLAWVIIQFRTWRGYNKLMVFGLVLSFIVVPLLIKMLILLFNTRTLHAYIADGIKVHSLIIWAGPYLFDLFLLCYFRKKIVITDLHTKQWIDIIFSLMLFLSVFSPLLLYIDEINRIFRNALLLKYLVMMSIAQYLSRPTRYILYSYLLLF